MRNFKPKLKIPEGFFFLGRGGGGGCFKPKDMGATHYSKVHVVSS